MPSVNRGYVPGRSFQPCPLTAARLAKLEERLPSVIQKPAATPSPGPQSLFRSLTCAAVSLITPEGFSSERTAADLGVRRKK